ncbi:membrane primary amine oxidase-like protein [Anopheles sinensis]|uniref:Membrane primary amine oxidase-like protein n=1 Tax=Anopheles sinensis TaxID=74873 RepID=A0A084WAY5_ANOSI|nr:membrane primary amine oxidase-like protein [Anopheles sinensis]
MTRILPALRHDRDGEGPFRFPASFSCQFQGERCAVRLLLMKHLLVYGTEPALEVCRNLHISLHASVQYRIKSGATNGASGSKNAKVIERQIVRYIIGWPWVRHGMGNY